MTEQEAKELDQCLSGLKDQVLVADNVKLVLAVLLAVLADDPEEVLHLLALALDPPGPPLSVLRVQFVVRFVPVAHSVCQSSVRGEHIERVAHHHKGLVGRELRTLVHNEWVVGLADPDFVIVDTLALHAHHLERCRRHQGHRRASGRASQLLDQSPQERIARARERSKLDVVPVAFKPKAFLSVQEPELAIPDPSILL